MWLIYISIALVVVFFVFSMINGKRELSNYQKEIEIYRDLIFGSESYKPEVKVKRVYGILAFELCFLTDKEKYHAKDLGLTDRFIGKVQELCNNLEVHGEKFDAELAVTAFSKDDELRWERDASSSISKG